MAKAMILKTLPTVLIPEPEPSLLDLTENTKPKIAKGRIKSKTPIADEKASSRRKPESAYVTTSDKPIKENTNPTMPKIMPIIDIALEGCSGCFKIG